nr:hypothetical protein [Tanacetum cinerariifolium]
MKSEERGEVDIETLIMEQYLTLDRRDTSRGMKLCYGYSPLALTGIAKRWLNRAPSGTINTWDLLKRIFILRFCPPSKNPRQLEEIHNFKQKEGLTATKALVSIQEMADHSHKWHKEESDRGIGEYNSNKMNIITDKLKNLNSNMQNLKENVHVIKGRYESCGGIYYGDNFLSIEEVKCIKETESREDSLMIDKFILQVDFVILDIMEDNKVPIILGRPMLVIAHARIDVLVPDDFGENLEEFLMNDDINGDLGDFLEKN